MGVVDKMHEMYEKALRLAHEQGELEFDCGRKEQALELRVQFYTYIRYVERTARNLDLPIEEQEKAKELLAMRQELSFKAYKNGVLMIKKRDFIGMMQVVERGVMGKLAGKVSLASVRNELDDGKQDLWGKGDE